MKLGKRDRTARLLKIEHLLYQNKNGCSVEEICEKCEVSRRTIYRDLAALESELKVPIWESGSKRGISEGYYLPPIRFSMLEAFNVFLAARLMFKYTHKYDENIASILTKLNSIVSPMLKRQIEQTIDLMQRQPRDEKLINNMTSLTEAWLSGHQVLIYYRESKESKIKQITIEPYFIEPSSERHSSWLIGYCPSSDSLMSFKFARIDSVKVTEKTYLIPADFNGSTYITKFWHTPPLVEDPEEFATIVLRFNSEAGKIVEEAIWHPSQVLIRQNDGSLLMTVKIAQTKQIQDWILQWGDDVEVLKPANLRRDIANKIKRMLLLYKPTL